MDHCCYNCPVANCTVRELLRHISYDNYCSCDNGAGTVAAAILSSLLMAFAIIIPFIIIALLFYHYVYKKKFGHQLDTRSDNTGSDGAVGIVSLFYRNICKKNFRHQNDQSDTRSDQQIEENTERVGVEGITYIYQMLLLEMKPQLLMKPMLENLLVKSTWICACICMTAYIACLVNVIRCVRL